jgi:NAD(P)-dependent dehydrogenase (short-subunit alcohol dehydrogenase family)
MSKTVLITGAGSGFGKLAAVALADRGHTVIATTETDAQADALRGEVPALAVERLDVTTDDVARVAGWELDVLIDNAGLGQTGPLADVPLDRVRRLFEVNVFGTLAVTQRALPGMVARGSGRVIIVSSVAGLLCAPTFGPYTMTKHALEAMGKTLRAELAPLGVDVTLLNPGPYATGFNDRMADSMWEWFGDGAVTGAAADSYRAVAEMLNGDQLDPADVATRMVELVEAEETTEHNYLPAEIGDLVRAVGAAG